MAYDLGIDWNGILAILELDIIWVTYSHFNHCTTSHIRLFSDGAHSLQPKPLLVISRIDEGLNMFKRIW